MAGADFAENEFADLADVFREGGTGLPVNFGENIEVEREGRGTFEAHEIKFVLGEHALFDAFGVGAEFGCGELVEEGGPGHIGDLANMLDGSAGAVGAVREFLGEGFAGAEKVGVINLPLAGFVAVGRGDAATGGAARFFLQDVSSVIFPREVEQAVAKIGDEGAFVDQQAGLNGVAFAFERAGFPPDFARIGDDTGTDGEMGNFFFDDASGQEIELNASGGVAGVGTTVDLEDDGDGGGRIAEFVRDLGDEAAFAFVAE